MSGINKNINTKSSSECPLCGLSSQIILTGELRRGEGTVFYCEECQHGYLKQIKHLDAKKYYAEDYRKEYSHNADVASTNAKELYDVYRNYQESRLHIIEPYLNKSTTLLEVGASSGQFLTHIMNKIKYVNAIELDEACCEFLQNDIGVSADSEYLRDSRFADELYDVVCSFQVMEHVENPVEFINDLRMSTKKGGWIFIEVPNLNDPLLSIWGVNSYQKFFYHSAHLHYFTGESLSKAAIDAGFSTDAIEIIYTQDYNILNHLHWIMNDGPQEDCHVGLNKVALNGKQDEINEWLTNEMTRLDEIYRNKLADAKCTSNMMMILKNG